MRAIPGTPGLRRAKNLAMRARDMPTWPPATSLSGHVPYRPRPLPTPDPYITPDPRIIPDPSIIPMCARYAHVAAVH
eukprot:7314347-Prymnesium_polylepis.1